MPIAQRRHPVYLRLQKPLEPIYRDAVTAVAWDDDEPIEVAEGVVYLVSRPCTQMRSWARALRALYRLDQTHEADESVSPLSLKPLRPEELRTIGVGELDVYSEKGNTVHTARSGYRLYWTLPLMMVILDRADGDPVGFVSFQMKWAVCAGAEDPDVDLEIEPGQAWITPACRKRRWGELAAIAIAMTARKHVDQVRTSTRWPVGFSAELKVTVGADIYSTSGEGFLRCCANYVSFDVDFPEGDRFQVSEVEFDPRW